MKSVFANKMEASDSGWVARASGTCELRGDAGQSAQIAPKNLGLETQKVVANDCHWKGTEHRHKSIRNHLDRTHIDKTFALSVHLDLDFNRFRTVVARLLAVEIWGRDPPLL